MQSLPRRCNPRRDHAFGGRDAAVRVGRKGGSEGTGRAARSEGRNFLHMFNIGGQLLRAARAVCLARGARRARCAAHWEEAVAASAALNWRTPSTDSVRAAALCAANFAFAISNPALGRVCFPSGGAAVSGSFACVEAAAAGVAAPAFIRRCGAAAAPQRRSSVSVACVVQDPSTPRQL
eukprot:SAG11_NODE_1759_length_4305_cov_3.542558_4_plen_179_part_00